MRRTLFSHLLVLALLAVSALPMLASQGAESDGRNSGIIIDGGISYILLAPDGWVLDNASGTGQGLVAVFYPQGSSWSAGQTVMYARVVEKGPGRRTLQEFIRADVREFCAASRRSTARHGSPLVTRSGQQAVVRYFVDGQNQNTEAVAYLDARKAVVVIALSSRTSRGYSAALHAFERLVGSYVFLGEKIY